MKFRHAFISAALLVSGVALAQGSQGTMQKGSETGKQGTMQGSMQKLMPKTEQEFAQQLHHANQMEIRLGKLAQEKGENDQVKQFGKRMVDDHGKADEQLMTLAKSQKWNLKKEPKPTNDVQRAMQSAEKADEAKLKALDGPAFDQAYMAMMVADHDADVMKVTHAAQMFKGEFATQLNQLRPTLMQHRDEAYRVLGQLKPSQQMGVGGANMGGMPMPDTQRSGQMGGTGGSGEMGGEMQTGMDGGTGGAGMGGMPAMDGGMRDGGR